MKFVRYAVYTSPIPKQVPNKVELKACFGRGGGTEGGIFEADEARGDPSDQKLSAAVKRGPACRVPSGPAEQRLVDLSKPRGSKYPVFKNFGPKYH